MAIRIRKHLRNFFWGTYEDVVNPLLKRKGSKWICSERVFENAFCIGQVYKINPKEILDIGCSRSSVPLELATLGFKVTGIDLREYFMTHENFKFIQGDLTTATFDSTFDLVTCISVFEHVGLGAYNEEPDSSKVSEFVEKMTNVITPGGHLILTMPLNTYRPGFINRYTLTDVEKLFSGLELIKRDIFELSGQTYKLIKDIGDSEVTACFIFKKND